MIPFHHERTKKQIRYRESNPRRLGESQTCYLLHHIGFKSSLGGLNARPSAKPTSSRRGSNPGPSACEADDLPTELREHKKKTDTKPNVGLEPTTSCSVGRRATIAPVRQNKQKRARIELANPKDLDLNQAHLTALLPLPKKRTREYMKPLGRIELPTCSLRVNRSATELKRLKQGIDLVQSSRWGPTTYRLTVCRTTDCATQAKKVSRGIEPRTIRTAAESSTSEL